MRFTEDASIYFEPDIITMSSLTAIDTQLIDTLTFRLSYNIEYETSPPPGRSQTETLSRATIVYGF